MIVVPDTNIIVAALVANGLCHELVHRTIRRRVLTTSGPLLKELDTVLRQKFVVSASSATFLRLFRASVRVVDVRPLPVQVCRDPTDDVVLATAVAAGADVIVTGDQDLLVLSEYAGVRIVSPRSLLEQLDREGSAAT